MHGVGHMVSSKRAGIPNLVTDIGSVNRIKTKLERIWAVYDNLSDVETTRKDALTARLTVTNHSPLKEVHCNTRSRNRFWTIEYFISLEVELPNCGCAAGSTYLKNGRFTGTCAEKFNANPLLSNIIKEVDIDSCVITISQETISVILLPYTSSCIRMLFPPLTYGIPSKPQECISFLSIIQLILSILQK